MVVFKLTFLLHVKQCLDFCQFLQASSLHMNVKNCQCDVHSSRPPPINAIQHYGYGYG